MARLQKRWDEAETARLHRLKKEGYKLSVIATVLGRSLSSVQRKVISSTPAHDDMENDYYFMGRVARNNGLPKQSPRGLSICDRYAWLAGWHDKDMELGYSVLEGIA